MSLHKFCHELKILDFYLGYKFKGGGLLLDYLASLWIFKEKRNKARLKFNLNPIITKHLRREFDDLYQKAKGFEKLMNRRSDIKQ